jgi:hypothetical protein
MENRLRAADTVEQSSGGSATRICGTHPSKIAKGGAASVGLMQAHAKRVGQPADG